MLYVHHLSSSTTDTELQTLFERVARVVNCDVVVNGTTRISRAIGFVEMATEKGARRAIAQLNGKELGGRRILIAEDT